MEVKMRQESNIILIEEKKTNRIEEVNSLTELHAHLMGMGNHHFWVNEILLDEENMPDNQTVKNNIREYIFGVKEENACLGPLIWDKNQFLENRKSLFFFFYLTHFEAVDTFPDIQELVFKEKRKDLFYEMQRYNLSFKDDFSFEVVFSLANLCDGLGVLKDSPDDLRTAKVEELLDIDFTVESPFAHKIIWNAQLRKIIRNSESAKARVENGFSMLNPDGTTPRTVDFHTFRGAFTPEFYPRRFALKDSLYEQRLDVLAHLLGHVLYRYGSCVPPVKYVELSVGSGDIAKPWVLDVLSVFKGEVIGESPTPKIASSFRKTILEEGNILPWISFLMKKVENSGVEYYFLAAFVRQAVNLPKDAMTFLNLSANTAISYMLDEISYSQDRLETRMFISLEKSLNEILQRIEEPNSEKNEAEGETLYSSYKERFPQLVVGLDLVGDEMGYPYCPFVTWKFLQFVLARRKDNPRFGVRVHAAENVPLVRPNQSGFRMYAAHMYILFLGIQFLIEELCFRGQNPPPVRIGHGIAFAFIFMADDNCLTNEKNNILYNHHKSSVLMSMIHGFGQEDKYKKNMVFEINPTSNFHLLRQNGDSSEHNPLYLLLKGGYKVTLSTDDDGIWPIDSCNKKHHLHHSLVAEYCNSGYLITDSGMVVSDLIDNANNAKFYSKKLNDDGDDGDIHNGPNDRETLFLEIIFRPFKQLWVSKDNYFSNILVCHTVNSLVNCIPLKEYTIKTTKYFDITPSLAKLLYENCKLIYVNLIQASKSDTCKLEFKIFGRTCFIYSMTDKFDNQQKNELNTTLIQRFSIQTNREEYYFLPDTSVLEKIIWEQNPENEEFSTKICVYTNFDKEKFQKGNINGKYEFSINSPLNSRNRGGVKIPFIYCACPHGGAASFAFHLLAEHLDNISMKKNQNAFNIIPFVPLFPNSSLPNRMFKYYLLGENHPLYLYRNDDLKEISQIVPKEWQMLVKEIRSGKTEPIEKIDDLATLKMIIDGILKFLLVPLKFETVSSIPDVNFTPAIPFPPFKMNNGKYLLCTKVNIIRSVKEISINDIERFCKLDSFFGAFGKDLRAISNLNYDFIFAYLRHGKNINLGVACLIYNLLNTAIQIKNNDNIIEK